jgi:hypothetical protein
VDLQRTACGPNDPNVFRANIHLAATLRAQVGLCGGVGCVLHAVLLHLEMRPIVEGANRMLRCMSQLRFCFAFHPSRALQRDYDAAKELLTSTIATLRTALGGWGSAIDGRLVCCFVDPANVRSPLSVGPAGPSHPILGLAMNNLGFVLKEAGQRERALECYEEALHIRTK